MSFVLCLTGCSFLHHSSWLTKQSELASNLPPTLYMAMTQPDTTVDSVQTAGEVATQLWEEWQSDTVEADVFNVNVPLGFKTVESIPVKPEILRTTVDMQSQYTSLYSKPSLSCMAYCTYAQLVAVNCLWSVCVLIADESLVAT